MANWNLPTITSGYINFVDEMNAKFTDAATLQNVIGTNIPLNTLRYNRSLNLFQEWLGPVSGWQNKSISIAGGGTGANNPSDVRLTLGLGTMSTQNNNNVNITGGVITNVFYSASDINTGILALARGGTGSSLALAGAGSVLGSFGGQVQFMNGQNISELYAGSLVSGTVPLARMHSGVALRDSDNIFSAGNTFNISTTFKGPTGVICAAEAGTLTLQQNYPIMHFFQDPHITSGGKIRRIVVNSGSFFYQIVDDTYTTITNALQISTDTTIIGYGGGLTNLNGSNITFGTVAPARLGSGSPSAATYLRGDGVWSAIASGGEVSPIPSGLIAIFDTGCPSGWTRVTGMDNRFILGSGSYGLVGGADTHRHRFNAATGGAGSHSHGVSASGGVTGSVRINGGTSLEPSQTRFFAAGSNQIDFAGAHNHNVDLTGSISSGSASVSGSTDGVGNHSHGIDDYTETVAHTPPYFSVVFCRKN